MNAFLRTRSRAAATALAAGALVVGGAGAVIAPAAAAPSGLFGSGAAGTTGAQGFTGAGGLGGLSGLFGGQGSSALPGPGLFKALFALFGAVQAQVPTIAGPIIAQAQTAGTITQAEATQLTALVSAKGPSGLGAGLGAGATPGSAGSAGSSATFSKPSAGEITVLHAVIAAVLGQLPTITGPVLASEVTDGDLTQAESDGITKLISGLAAMASNSTAVGSATTGAIGSTAGGGGNLLSSLAAELSAKLKKPASSAKTKKPASSTKMKQKKTAKHTHHAKSSKTTRTHHSG